MKEIEVKVIEIDKREMTGKLRVMGARKVFEGKIYTVFFGNAILKKKNYSLRLRKKRNKSYLAIKRFISNRDAKVVDETELEVADFEKMKNILLLLDFRIIKTLSKSRTSYKIGKTLFEIDKYKKIPAFMEIESPDIKSIKKYAKMLKIKNSKIKTWGTTKLLKHYLK